MEKDYTSRKRQVIYKEKKISADLFMAASIGDREWLVQSLKDGQNPNSHDKRGLAAIHLAAIHGNLNCLKLLVEKFGVDVNLPSATGWNPLHFCLNKESGMNAKICMQYLLDCGARPDCKTDDNVTLFHQAAAEGLTDCLKILLQTEAPIDILDSRGHSPYDIAKLWGHRVCARILHNELWNREKNRESEEKKKLQTLKRKFGNYQKDALQQLHNDQDFYGNETFTNWLEAKGYAQSSRESQVAAYNNERFPDNVISGLAKRLTFSGGIEDCSSRLQRFDLGRDDKHKSDLGKKLILEAIQPKTPKAIGGTPRKLKSLQRSASASKIKKISSTLPKYQYLPKIWNVSTNVNSNPVTDIRNIETISLSIQPDEERFPIFAPKANLTVRIEEDYNKEIAIKVMSPNGRMRNAGLYIPKLPPALIRQTLSGSPEERIKVPQEMKAVHIDDISHKRRPTSPPYTEVPMHLVSCLEPLSESSSSATLIHGSE